MECVVPFLLICAMVALVVWVVVGAKGTFDRLVASFRGLIKQVKGEDKKPDLRKSLSFAADIGCQSAGCIVLIILVAIVIFFLSLDFSVM